jgi:uncharacterized protein
MPSSHTSRAWLKRNAAVVTFAGMILLWIGAWLLKLFLDARVAFFTLEWVNFLYWLLAKLTVWILPSLFLLRATGRTARGLFPVSAWRKWLLYGGCVGGALALVNVACHGYNHTAVLPAALTFSVVSAVTVAPIFEEFTMRGAIFGALRQKYSFLWANTLTALLFVVLHCPGWYFMGTLRTNLLSPVGGALSIFAIGWLCGLAAERGKSVLAAMIVHFLNNITA